MTTDPTELIASESELKKKFFSLKKPEDIANLLELKSLAYLNFVIFVTPPAHRYAVSKLPKKHGGFRIIHEPNPKLKIIQKKLSRVLQVVYRPKFSVHGFVKNKSIVTNASRHKGNRFVFNIDLKDFFPAIHFGRVKGMFEGKPYNFNSKVATHLARICGLYSGLPQGAPTSPIISNMICAKLDSQLQKLAKKHRCYYTRYVDDITFSSNQRTFPADIAEVTLNEYGRKVECGTELISIVKNNGFEINTEKVRLQEKNKRQEVTGLTINEFVNVNRKFLREVRAMLHSWEKKGYKRTEQRFQDKYYKKPDKSYKHLPTFHQVIKGKIEFVGMVRGHQDEIFVRYNNKAGRLEIRDGLTPVLFEDIPVEERVGLISREAQRYLKDKLKDHFSLVETKELCFELGVEPDDLSSLKTEMQIQLIQYLNRLGRISELISACSRHRPHLSWDVLN